MPCTVGGPSHPTHLVIQDDTFRNNLDNPATIRGYLRDLDGLQKWAESIRSPISALRDLDVAAYLRDQASRGSSVPNRLIHTLVWFEKVFGFDLSTSSVLVRSQSRPPSRLPAPPPKQAKMVLVKMVADMKGFIRSAHTPPLRCFAGLFAAWPMASCGGPTCSGRGKFI